MSIPSEKRPGFTFALLFLRIGTLGFCGALANMALVEQACVKEYQWLTSEQYLEGAALSYLLRVVLLTRWKVPSVFAVALLGLFCLLFSLA